MDFKMMMGQKSWRRQGRDIGEDRGKDILAIDMSSSMKCPNWRNCRQERFYVKK